MRTDFVSRVHDHTDLLGKGFERVSWDEPTRFQIILLEELEQARRTDLAGEESARDIVWGVFATI